MSHRLSRRSERGAGIFARARRAAGRKAVAAAIAVPLAATGLALAAAGSAHAVAASQPICHATAPGKYNLISPSIDATGLKGGHTGHADDIIPPFTYTNSAGVLTNYPGLNWNATGQAIFNNGCAVPPTTITPVDPTVVEANCVAGLPTPPSLTLPTTPAGVAYTASPGGPYAAGQTVTVTASNTDPTQWFQTAPKGWTFVDVETEAYQFTFGGAPPCGAGAPTAVDPVAPTVTDSVCAAGVATTPTLVPASSPVGVSYAASAPAAAGTSVTVTATITDPALYVFIAPALGSWTFVDSTHETYAVTFAPAPVCGAAGGGGGGGGGGAGGAGGGVPLPTTVTPVAPSFGDPVCGAGGVTAPFVTTPSTPAGVAYTVSPAGPYTGGQTVTVTATITDPADQFVAPGAGGWTFVDATHETIAHTFAATPICSGVGGLRAVAVMPTFTDATCVDGTPDGAFYTLPAMDGVRYAVDGRHRTAGSYAAASGSTVTVTMTATAGYTLTGAASVTHTFAAAPQCLGVQPATTSRHPLANTGTPVVPLTELGALLTVLGAALAYGGRRRRRKAL